MVRFKNRYFAIEVEPRDVPGHVPFEIGKVTLYHEILKQVELLHGDFGVASVATGLVAKYCNPYTKIALVRCRHGPHRFVATALPLIKQLKGKHVKINILYVGATISKCYKYIVRHQQRSLEKYWNKMKSDTDRLQMKKAFFELSEMQIAKRGTS
ncbi:UNVERIFIED_CONTAM: hypothetical protein PYX00_007456 [Menopon gallinae]|uniref:Ribonuclease P/MRP protein subunit POP5 n=1 Tax=Menopon gallinae TaxID=328185 RepID=A0AAW2HJ18_9NEOP